ncbi:MAG: PorT family protein, partial [Bacteroidales bacterium]|nr:PorT family protein [Bacteroidales bacterium]
KSKKEKTMKTNIFILLLSAMCVHSTWTFAQESESKNEKSGLEANEFVDEVKDSSLCNTTGDTTNFTLGKRDYTIVEKDDETWVKIKHKDKDKAWEKTIASENKFRGHWSGIEFGINNYMDADYSLSRTPENQFMDINTGKSWFVNFNIAQFSIPITRDFGMVSGMGFHWNTYRFDGNNTIQKVDGVVVTKEYTDTIFDKSKLHTCYLSVPLLLEAQFLKNNKLFVTAGVIGGLKLYSNTKLKYHHNGNKRKEKHPNDFNLNQLRLGTTLRVGYDDMAVFASYYFTPLFEEDKGPELYPFNVGIAFTFD